MPRKAHHPPIPLHLQPERKWLDSLRIGAKVWLTESWDAKSSGRILTVKSASRFLLVLDDGSRVSRTYGRPKGSPYTGPTRILPLLDEYFLLAQQFELRRRLLAEFSRLSLNINRLSVEQLQMIVDLLEHWPEKYGDSQP